MAVLIRQVVRKNVSYRKMVDLKIDVKSLTQVDIIDQVVKHYCCFVLLCIRVFAKIL